MRGQQAGDNFWNFFNKHIFNIKIFFEKNNIYVILLAPSWASKHLDAQGTFHLMNDFPDSAIKCHPVITACSSTTWKVSGENACLGHSSKRELEVKRLREAFIPSQATPASTQPNDQVLQPHSLGSCVLCGRSKPQGSVRRGTLCQLPGWGWRRYLRNDFFHVSLTPCQPEGICGF